MKIQIKYVIIDKKRKDCVDMNMKILENIIRIIFSSAVIFGVPLSVIYFSDMISDKAVENLESKNIRKEKMKKIIYNNNLRFIVYIFMILMVLSFIYLKVLPFLPGIWISILFVCLCIMNKRLGDNLNDYLEKTLLKEEK